jgi:hypothetical protein
MPAKKEWIGKVFNRWTVTAEISNPRTVAVLCSCGTASEVSKSSLATGMSQSCGCLKSERTRERFAKTIDQKLWSRCTKVENGCWEWDGSINQSGYGTIGVNRSSKLAHRVAWEESNGAIPNGLFVLHACDNRRCINPAHLWLGTNDDNMKDMARKGRGGSFWDTATDEQKAAKKAQLAELGKRMKTPETKKRMSATASNRRRIQRADGTWFWGKG